MRWASRLESRWIHVSIQFPSVLLVVGGLSAGHLVSQLEMVSKWERTCWWQWKEQLTFGMKIYIKMFNCKIVPRLCNSGIYLPPNTHTLTPTLIFASIFKSQSGFYSIFGENEIASLSHVCPQIMGQCSCGFTRPSSLPRLPAFVLSLCSFAADCCWKLWENPMLLITASIVRLIRGVIWGKGKCPFTTPTFGFPC